MAAAFAKLPCKVLWRLTSSEIPDASAPFRLGSNTKVPAPAIPICAYHLSDGLLSGNIGIRADRSNIAVLLSRQP